jgi:hypothetical protein
MRNRRPLRGRCYAEMRLRSSRPARLPMPPAWGTHDHCERVADRRSTRAGKRGWDSAAVARHRLLARGARRAGRPAGTRRLPRKPDWRVADLRPRLPHSTSLRTLAPLVEQSEMPPRRSRPTLRLGTSSKTPRPCHELLERLDEPLELRRTAYIDVQLVVEQRRCCFSVVRTYDDRDHPRLSATDFPM